ncbi:MAG TPA: ABC transporter permease [Candidatus Limnocylindrales bacterium]|nr:ABC transporter permease [Candidatus Limnocylindrales bacterium]
MNIQPKAFASLTLANLRMYLRNPVASMSLFGALVFLLLFLKVAEGGPAQHTKVEIVVLAHGADAAALLAAIRQVKTFDVTETTAAAAHQALSAGKTDMTITIPSTLTPDDAGRLAPVHLPIAYRAGTSGEASLPVVAGVVDAFNQQLLHQSPIVTLQSTAINARSYGAIDFLLPGVIAFNIIGSGLMIAAGTFANYKSTGVLRRLKATGITATTFVLAHATSSFVLGMSQVAVIVAVAILLFSFHLDLAALLAVTALGYIVFLALGFTIAGWIRDPQRASGVSQAVAFPLIFIALLTAGLPPTLAAVTKYLPVSYVTDAMRQIGEGAGLGALHADLLWLIAWAAILLIAAGRAFRWD